MVWDAPGHAASRPFKLDFSLADKAKWLHGILEREGIQKPILIGQSMGGYVSQYYMELYPGETGGFISIDSAPLKRRYLTAVELWLLERIEPVYRIYPRKALLRDGSKGCSETAFGRKLMMADEVGRLDRRIHIMTYGETTDQYGLTHQGLVDAIGNAIWARIEPARGKTYYEQYKDKVELITKIIIRYRPGINESMLVQYKDKTYRIMSVVDPYEAHIKLELMCNLKTIGEDDSDDD